MLSLLHSLGTLTRRIQLVTVAMVQGHAATNIDVIITATNSNAGTTWRVLHADLKQMLKQLRTPGGSVSVMPEGIAGALVNRPSVASCCVQVVGHVLCRGTPSHAWSVVSRHFHDGQPFTGEHISEEAEGLCEDGHPGRRWCAPLLFMGLILEDEIGMQRWYKGYAHSPNGIWSVQTWCLSTTRAYRSC